MFPTTISYYCLFSVLHYLILIEKPLFSSCEIQAFVYTIVCRCMVAFPDDYKSLVPKLLIETMAAVGSSFVSCINLATGDVVPETKALTKGCI